MLTTLAIANYRSLQQIVLPLGSLNLVIGANGSGKSSLYRALRLLAATAGSGVVQALALEGGLHSTLWAGPEKITRAMRSGAQVEGTVRQDAVALRMGFAADDYGYAIDLGLPQPSASMFAQDPEIKVEAIWAGPFLRPGTVLAERRGPMLRAREGRGWRVLNEHLRPFDSLFDHAADPGAPEILQLRERIRSWRFYDHFRSDHAAPARSAQPGTRTPVLAHDGSDLAAAWQTIVEIGDAAALAAAVDDAFPGARVHVQSNDGRFTLLFRQHGLLRELSAAELSDGTLRYLLWIAALHTPRPPPLMVLNEPETSLHPDLLPALGRLIVDAARRSQLWVVSHAPRLIAALEGDEACTTICLDKHLGQTTVVGQGLLDQPPWHWPAR